jgi:enoyl-CoA hydratase/carnithine racemase
VCESITRAEIFERLIEDGGAGIEILDLQDPLHSKHAPPRRAPALGTGILRLGFHRHGSHPEIDLGGFDILLTTAADPPAPWVFVPRERLDLTVSHLAQTVSHQPTAAAVLGQVLRLGEMGAFEQALMLESLAFSMLLASAGFNTWRAATPSILSKQSSADVPRVAVDWDGEHWHIRLSRPEARNAVDALMRDALVDALQSVADDPGRAPVILSGDGPIFCAGGDLNEFGRAHDVGIAHLIRTTRAPAALIHRIRDRVTVNMHGAGIGAGIEMPAAAGRIVATRDTLFRLPEVGMGLIPGAGGTVSLPRRIGRHRACFMALSAYDIDAPTALSWGLIDALSASSDPGSA